MKTIKLVSTVLTLAGILFFTAQTSAQTFVMNNTPFDMYVASELGDNATCIQTGFFTGTVPSNPGVPFMIYPTTEDILFANISTNDPLCTPFTSAESRSSCIGGTITPGSASCLPSFQGNLFGAFMIIL